MSSCKKCGGDRIRTVAPTKKHLAGLGLPVRVSGGVVVNICEGCGEEDLLIHDMDQLLRVAAINLAFVPYKLNGSEIRFCRRAIKVNGKTLADLLSVTAETVSRWENDKQTVNDALEKMLRVMIVHRIGKEIKGEQEFDINQIFSLDLSPLRGDADVPLLSYGPRRRANGEVAAALSYSRECANA